MTKKLIVILAMLVGLVSGAWAGEYKFVKSQVWPAYEFNENENPKQYYWCGHTSLQVVAKYKTGEYKRLYDIHKIFLKNSPRGYAADNYCYNGNHWCAKLQDLYWAAKLTKNNGYGAKNTYLKVAYNYKQFFSYLKQGIKNDIPVIVPSMYYYGNAGHFWIITGYYYNGSFANTTLYLRDVAEEYPIYPQKYDKQVKLKYFFDDSGFSKMYMLFIKK